MKLLETEVAYFTSLHSKVALPRSVGSIVAEIRNGKHASQIAAIRHPVQSEEHRTKLKRDLPSFMASGTSKGGHSAADFDHHSGLLQIDIDDVGVDKAPNLRDTIGKDEHTLAAFISPSGNGVKALFRIPASKDTHLAAFEAAADYFRSRYGIKIDPSCKDISRLCFVSDDPDLVVNPECTPLELVRTKDKREDTSPGGQKTKVESSQLPPIKHSSESCILHGTSCILHNTFDDWPDLKPIYERNVSRYYARPQKGQRNPAIIAISARLFYFVKPEFVVLMLDAYRQEHHEVFADYPPADFAREVHTNLEGCEGSFQQELNELERSAYLDLPEQEKPAFRIARSLSNCESDSSLPPCHFFLSCHELGVRLGLFDTQAGRILQRLEKSAIIEKVKNGTKREKGQRGTATVWRWLLAEESTSQPG
jgi:hypothetical protein